MKNPSKSNFQLEKIKLIKEGGLSVKFSLIEVIGAETYSSSQIHESTRQPHPDLTNKLEQMAIMVAQVFGFTAARDVVFKKEFGANVSQKEYMTSYVDQMAEKIRVTGFSVSGEDAKKGVVITSSFAVDNKQRVAINTPRILVESESRGFEEKLANLVETATDEAYQFIYEGKVADPEMFEYSDEEEATEE